jgi:CheY-like chemotaxis protein
VKWGFRLMSKRIHRTLVLLDVLMPKQSGIRLYRELKTDKALKNIPVIMLSGVAKSAPFCDPKRHSRSSATSRYPNRKAI